MERERERGLPLLVPSELLFCISADKYAAIECDSSKPSDNGDKLRFEFFFPYL